MLVLDRIEPRRCQLAWRPVDTALPGSGDVSSVEHRLQELGVVHFSALDPGTPVTFDHTCSASGEAILWRSRTPLTRLCIREQAFYVAASLAPVTWASTPELLSVHLALYELIVNVHEHGRARPAGDGRLSLTLRVSVDEIRGTLSDDCERFDPSQRAPVDIAGRLARRENRGYGVAMIERALDEIDYEYGATGNLITFRKRILR